MSKLCKSKGLYVPKGLKGILLLAGMALAAASPAWAQSVIMSGNYFLTHSTDGHTLNSTAATTFDPNTCLWYVNNRYIQTANSSGTAFSGNYYLQRNSFALGGSSRWTQASNGNTVYYSTWGYGATYYYLRLNGTTWQVNSTNSNNGTLYTVTRTSVAQSVTTTYDLTAPTITPSTAGLYNSENATFSGSSTITTTTTTIPAHTTYTFNDTTYYYYNNMVYTSTDDFKSTVVTGPTGTGITYTWTLSSTANASVNASGVVTVNSAPATDQTVTLTCTARHTASGTTKTSTVTLTIYAEPVTPVITLLGGDQAQITCASAGATIYYTTDGSEPTSASTEYTGPFDLTSQSTTVKAIAIRGGHNSTVATETLTRTVAKPSISIDGSGNVTITCATDGATIYYTTDGSEPTGSSTAYSAPFAVSSGTTVKAIAVKGGYANSAVASSMYVTSGVSGGVVTLNDLEDHSWSYYSDPDCPIRSLGPADVKITYYGNGTGTVSTTNGATPGNSSWTADASGVQVSSSETENTFVYYKTLERTDGSTSANPTGRCAYTTIPNPFSVRPTYQYATGDLNKYCGFYAWRVKSVSGGTIHTAATGGTQINANDIINAETEVFFAPASETGMTVELEALWARAYVVTSNTTTGLNNSVSYERNFVYLSSNTTLRNAALSCPVTYTTVDPATGAGTKRTITIRDGFACGANTKFENVTFAQYNGDAQTMTASNHDLVVGRGCSGTINYVSGVNANVTSPSYTIRLESGTFNYLSFLRGYSTADGTATDVPTGYTSYTVGGTPNIRGVLGCDYDRATNSGITDNLIINNGAYYGYSVSEATGITYSDKSLVVHVKSGKIGNSFTIDGSSYTADAAQSLYIGIAGQRVRGHRQLYVEGGQLASIAGGIDATQNQNNNSVTIRMTGGHVRGSVYGGAARSAAYGNRNIIVTGGLVTGWLGGGCNGEAYPAGQTSEDTYGGITNGLTRVYFGGKGVCGGTGSNVNINGSQGGIVFGAGKGVEGNTTSGRMAQGTTVVVADECNIERNVYGGGNFGYAQTSTDVYISGGTVQGSVFGGSNQNNGPSINIKMIGGLVEGGVYGGSNTTGTISGNVTMHIDGGQVGTPSQHANIHGGGYGSATRVLGSVNLTLGSGCDAESGVTVYGDVYGGSAEGRTNGNTSRTSGAETNVSLYKGTIYGGLYGGGLGSASNAAHVYGPVEVKVYGGSVRTNDGTGENGSGGVFGCNNTNGSPQLGVTVDIYGTDPAPAEGEYALYAVYGGGNRSNYTINGYGIPKVTIHGCSNSIEYVYGGGNASDVRGTDVSIWGGNIGNAFGGGNGKGESNPGANITASGTNLAIHGGTIGAAFGGSNQKGYINNTITVVVEEKHESGTDPCTGAAYPDCGGLIVELYGGGNAAEAKTSSNVYITPDVQIKTCDFAITNLFGGAKAANYEGDITLYVDKGNFENVFCGNNEGGTITGSVTLVLRGGTMENAFGGNNAGGDITGSITVLLEDAEDAGCPLHVDNIYGGGKDAAYTPSSASTSPVVNIYHGTVHNTVFGGGLGSGATVTANPQVTIGHAATPSHSATVGGTKRDGAAGVGNVYGGGSLASVVGNTTVIVEGSLANTHVKGDIFGGGKGRDKVETDRDSAIVSGNTLVDIRGGMIDGNVYGGGELSSVGGSFTSEGDLSGKSAASGNTKVLISGGQIGDLDALIGSGADKRKMGRPLNDKGYVFGAGKGKVDADSWLEKFAYVDSTYVEVSGGRIAASLFGGGENGRVRLGTYVKITNGTVGRELADDDGVDSYTAAMIDSIEHREVNGQGVQEIYFGNVYGGGRGIDIYEHDSKPVYSQTAGRVFRNTMVDIAGGRVTHNVYGGGSLASVGIVGNDKTGLATVSITGGIIGYDDGKTTFTAAGAYSYDGTVYSTLSAENRQKVKDFYLRAGINEGRVYGSGRGQVSSDEDEQVQFKDLAFVNSTDVTIGGTAQVRGSVFGGGANGHVRQNTDVKIAESAMVGVPLMNAPDWGGESWKVSPDGYVSHDTLTTGNTLSQAYYDAESNFNGGHLHERWVSTDGTSPTIYRGNVYGGGRGISPTEEDGTDISTYHYSATAGRVYGNTKLTLTGGTVFHDAYGGGSLASVGNAVASISGDKAIGLWGNEYAKADGYVDSIATNLTTMRDTLLTRYTRDYQVGDPITGTGSATVILNGGTVGTDGIGNGDIYGGGRGIAGATSADVTHLAYANNTYVTIKSGTALGAVFGGGANGHVSQNSYVRMSGGTVGSRLPLAERKVDDKTGHGYRVYRGNLYGGGRGVDPVGDGAHLSNTAGRVYGNTRVCVTGGQVYHSVYGGGSLASVGTYILHNTGTDKKHYYVQGTGQASVTIKGKAWIGHKSTDLEKTLATYTADEITTAKKLLDLSDAEWTGLSDVAKQQDLIELNYQYLGANSAMVFGSGRGVGALKEGTLYEDYAEAAFTHNTIVTLIDDGGDKPMVCGSVFGGGENGHVKHNTFVDIQGGRVGGIPLHDKEYKPYTDGFSSNSSLTLALEYEDLEDETGTGTTVYRGNVYGGGRGVDHSDLIASTKGYSVSAGRVYGNTEVSVSGGAIYHHVFGGGSLASVGTYDTNANGQPTEAKSIFCLKTGHTVTFTDGVATLPSMSNADTVQYPTGIATVTISGGQIGRYGWNEGSVFGGGRGIAGDNTAQVTHLAYVDRTIVNIESGARVMGSVFGGGANGHVLDSTYVLITGGIVGHALEAADTLTTIYGYAPRTVFRGNVYGGGRGVDPAGPNKLSRTAGRVYGNTHVLIKGGWVRHSVFGGGSMASVGTYDTATAATTIDGISYAAGDITGLAAGKDDESCGRAWVEIKGGWIGSRPTTGANSTYEGVTGSGGEGRNNGRVFGACRGTAGPEYDKLAYVNITRVIIGAKDSTEGPCIMGCVFGSGENGHVLDSTLVQMHSGDIGRLKKVNDWKRTYIGNLYGGGRGIDLTHTNELSSTAGWVRNSTRVEMTGGHVWHNVYGGGSLASVGPLEPEPAYVDTYKLLDSDGKLKDRKGRATVIITGGKVGHDGLYDGNVFGAGRGRAGSNTDTIYHICSSDCTYVPTGSSVTIGTQSYKTTRLNPSGENLLLRAITPGDIDLTQEVMFVVRNSKNTADSTKTHDFSKRTNIHNAYVVVNYAGNDTTDGAYDHICGSVYGSGDNGHVLNSTLVEIKGGTVGNRFKTYPGTIKAKLTSEEQDNTADNGMVLTAGSVYGSGRGLDHAGVSEFSPTAGRVYGHTEVKVSGGNIMRNVYGGGNMAGVGQYTITDNVVTSYTATTGTATVTVSGGTIGQTYAIEGNTSTAGGNVFGSSRGLSANDDLVRTMAFVRQSTVNIDGGTIRSSVFGGGENGHVWDNTYVYINDGIIGYDDPSSLSEPIYLGNVYGGGRGIDLNESSKVSRTSGAVYGNTNVVVRGGTVYHNVFGGGSLASVGRYIFFDEQTSANQYVPGPAYNAGTDSDKKDSVLRLATVSEITARGITVASTGGTATVAILGGQVGVDAKNNGRVFGAGRGIALQDENGNAFNYYTFVDQTLVTIDSMATINGCVFGSGDNGHVSGSTHVVVQQTKGGTAGYPIVGYQKGGPVNGNIFGGGRGADRGRRTAVGDPYYYSPMAGRVRGNTQVDILAGTIKNNVYGGGFMANVAGNTAVNIGTATGTPDDFAIYGDVFGGSALGPIGSASGTTTVNILSGTIGCTDADLAYNAGKKGNVFGGGNGDAGKSGSKEAVDVFVDGTADTKAVSRPANVLNAVQVYIGKTISAGNATVLGSVYGCNNIDGSPEGSVQVDIYKTYRTTAQEAATGNAYALRGVFGGGNQADYTAEGQTATVYIHGCENTVMSTYGGGNAAAVPATSVTVDGGRLDTVFAGGNGRVSAANVGYSDITSTGNATVTVHGGIVHHLFGGSNTNGTIRGTSKVDLDPDGTCDTLDIDEIFGGSNLAEDSGTIIVDIPCGIDGLTDVYGCSNEADFTGNVVLNVYGGEMDNVYGGSKNAKIDGDVTLNIYGGKIHRAFGGNNVGGNITGQVTVHVNLDTAVSCTGDKQLDTVFGGGNMAAYYPTSGDATPLVRICNDTITSTVFGGGLGNTARCVSSPKVMIGGFSKSTTDTVKVRILDDVYGGGMSAPVGLAVGDDEPYASPARTATAKVDCTPTVLMRSADLKRDRSLVLGNIFGGGLGTDAIVVGGTRVDIRGLSEVMGNVYGGGNAGKVLGKTDVSIGEH